MTDDRADARMVEETLVAAPIAGEAGRAPAGGTGLVGRAGWAMLSFGGSLAVKLSLNVILSRLLVPEIFGIMVIVNALRVGIELLTDVGIEQNIVHNERGEEPEFLNTAWTMQMVRGLCLSLVFLALAPLAARFYDVDMRVFALISLAPLLNSLHSTAIFVLVKHLEVKRRNLFEFGAELANLIICCVCAWISPTIWSLLVGVLLSIAFRSALSYTLPYPGYRLVLKREHVRAIFGFGRWIFLASLLTYAGGNLDRLTLGKLAPLTLLGIYGLARTISELPVTMAGRLSYQVIFPAIAAGRGDDAGRSAAQAMYRPRLIFLVVAALGVATVAAWSDVAVGILYDSRFQLAGPMLCLLLAGSWLAVVSTLNEALVLGAGQPRAITLAGIVRIAIIGIGLPTGYMAAGFPGAIAAVVVGEGARYAALAAVQARHGLWLARQDLIGTAAFAVVLLGWIAARGSLSLGMPWEGLP